MWMALGIEKSLDDKTLYFSVYNGEDTFDLKINIETLIQLNTSYFPNETHSSLSLSILIFKSNVSSPL